MPKSKEFLSSSDSDSDVEPKPKKKREEKKKEEKKKPSSKPSGSQDGAEVMLQLSKMRYVNVSEFRGRKMVNIREYYNADGELKPGRKGISLMIDQWEKLKEYIPEIDEALKNM